MWHQVLVTVHAVFATAALAAGLLALRAGSRVLLRAHTVCIAAMSGVLPVSIAAGWSDFDGVTRPVFIGLFLLSAFMVLQAVRAERAARAGRARNVVDHVGFNLISLVIGFLIVLVLGLGGGAVGIAVAVVATIVVGHFALRRVRAAREAGPLPG